MTSSAVQCLKMQNEHDIYERNLINNKYQINISLSIEIIKRRKENESC